MTTFKIGDEVAIRVKAVTTDRQYNVAGRILSLHGHLAQVEYRQPYSVVNGMRKIAVDLRECKPIKRRLKKDSE